MTQVPSLALAVLFNAVDFAINKVLALDPHALAQCQRHQGKIIALSCNDLTLYIVFTLQGLQLQQSYSGAIDAHMSGSLMAFKKILSDKDAALANPALNIQGDTELLQELRVIAQNLDIDWEEQLSHYTGDLVAHPVAKLARQSLAWLQTQVINLKQNQREYFQEELRVSPAAFELETFFNDINQLQLATDRLLARFTQLKNGVSA